jgi:hypothetical protein
MSVSFCIFLSNKLLKLPCVINEDTLRKFISFGMAMGTPEYVLIAWFWAHGLGNTDLHMHSYCLPGFF